MGGKDRVIAFFLLLAFLLSFVTCVIHDANLHGRLELECKTGGFQIVAHVNNVDFYAMAVIRNPLADRCAIYHMIPSVVAH
ncbi:hypothetical protein BKA59DRAFT_467033 [Fusarium tricinctum]|uniref:Uncharacterized protein n=1 Tax=Fusarium tricinctum TaxID=61284 RepID=A0A8K0S250_9HYPO|nr:hypothetical protein BKA59DRAFT_467033 [Fusarium tricinctum]